MISSWRIAKEKEKKQKTSITKDTKKEPKQDVYE